MDIRELLIEGLVERVPANQIVAAVRSPQKASGFGMLGVQVREADYTRPETLSTALHGVKKVLLISAAEIRQSFEKRKAVIDAAKQAGVELFAYTSLLRVDSAEMFLDREHKQNGGVHSGFRSALRDSSKRLVSGKSHISSRKRYRPRCTNRKLQRREFRIGIARRLCSSRGCRPHAALFGETRHTSWLETDPFRWLSSLPRCPGKLVEIFPTGTAPARTMRLSCLVSDCHR
jgi:hypothetical protein